MTRARTLSAAIVLPVLFSATAVAWQVAAPPVPPAPPGPAGQAGQSRDALGQPNATPGDFRGAVFGTVYDASSGQPLEGVRLNVSGRGVRGGSSAVSDADGRFAFAGLGVGDVTLRATKAGYVSITYGQLSPAAGRTGTPIELTAGQVIKDLKIELPRGGVITGIVVDEKNRPSVGTPVRVLRWSIATGERTLTSAGSATTDDRGMYRVYGLAPGDYIVNAVARSQVGTSMVDSAVMAEMMERVEALRATELALSSSLSVNVSGSSGPVRVSVDGQEMEFLRGNEPPPAFEGYAPVYYPGTAALGSAASVSVGVSEEKAGIDFALARVMLARVEGMVALPPGLNATNIQLRLVDMADRVPGINTPTARTQRDGRFTFTGVAPGQYQLVASATVRPQQVTTGRPTGAGANFVVAPDNSAGQIRLWGMTEISVNGTPLANVGLTLQTGISMGGRLVFEGAAQRPAPTARVRLTAGPVGAMASAMGAPSVTATVEPDGRFTFTGLVPGQYRVRSLSGASGWSLGTAMAGGQDTLDFPFEIQPGQPAPELLVTATDRTSTLNGGIQDALGRPTAGFTVILFPAEQRYWLPQARRIRSTRPSTGGKFSFGGLPPGDYRLAAVIDVESGQWYDPEFLKALLGASVPVSIGEGQTQTQDLRIAG